MAGGSSNDDDGMVSGINVTPLVDVTLVLLIIFMVTARIIVSQGMPMDLPKAASGEALQQVFSVELSADGKTRVDSDNLGSDEAITPLAKAAKAKNADLRRPQGRARPRDSRARLAQACRSRQDRFRRVTVRQERHAGRGSPTK